MNLFSNPDPGQPLDLPTKKALRGILRSPAAYTGLAIGIALFVSVIVWQGIGDVLQALSRAGWGIIAIALLHLPSLWADATGWRSLFPPGQRPPRRVMLRARWIGESINDLLPVLQMGGNVVKAWLLSGRGVQVGQAGATVIVDVTLVVMAQILFTLVGIGLVAPTLGSKGALLVILAGTVILSILLLGFYEAQRRGFIGIVVRVSRKILGPLEWDSVSEGAARIDSEVLRLYRERRLLLTSGFWHILSWFLGVGEVWFALRLLGHPVDFGTALLFESLGQAIRTGAFAVPGALGIQEGGYILVGGALGIEPSISLALSIARRVRELLLGLPGLAFWQASTIHRVLLKAINDRAATPSGRGGMP
jgi:putative membrane protein